MPDTWVDVPLQQIADVIDPHPSHRAPDEVRDGVPFAGIGDFNSRGDIVNPSVRRVSPKILKEHSYRYRISANTIGFGRVASIGKVVDFSTDTDGITISPTMAVIEPKSIDKKFLVSALQGNIFVDRIGRLLTGTTRSSLGIELLRKLEVPIPSDPHVAEKIGRIFSTIDEAIEQTEALIAKTQQIKAGLIHDLFTRGVTPDGQLRPPREEAPQLYRESPLGWIPKEWEFDTFGSWINKGVISEVQDGNHGEQHPKREDFVSEGIPFLMANDLAGGKIDFRGCYRITFSQYQSLRIGFSTEGDVLLSHKGTIGETAIVPAGYKDVMLTPQVTLYRIGSSRLSNEFLLYWMRSGVFQRQMKRLAAQSTRDYVGITAQRLLLSMALPERNEQELIAARIGAVFSRIHAENLLLGKQLLLKRGLMIDLLSGHVVIPISSEVHSEAVG